MRAIGVLFFILQASLAWAWPSRVERVVDGDTLLITVPGTQSVKVRLYGIDCPEAAQEAGDKATAEAHRLTQGQLLQVEAQGRDRYGRIVAIIYLSNGSTLQEALVAAGVAWVAPRYCKRPECQDWKTLEDAARFEQRGLWEYSQPVAPWEWRKQRRE